MSAEATSVTQKLIPVKPRWSGQVGAGGVADGTTQTIPLASTTDLDNGDIYIFTVNRVDANTVKQDTWETGIGELSGSNLINCVRRVEGNATTSTSWAAGTVVEILFTAKHWNNMIDFLGVQHNSDGTHSDITADTVTATGVVEGGSITAGGVAVPTISSTSTLTNKRITARVASTTDDATAEINCDTTDQYELSAIANATTFTVTGTPTDGQKLIIRFKDAGAAKGLTFTGFTALGVTIPTTTVESKWGYVGAVYNLAATTWHILAVGQES